MLCLQWILQDIQILLVINLYKAQIQYFKIHWMPTNHICFFRFVKILCPMLTNVSLRNIKPTWICAIKIWMDYGIGNQTAHFLKSSRLCAGTPVQCGQCGDQKAAAVRSTVYNKSIRKVLILISTYIHITVLLAILIINLVCSPA